MSIIDNLFYNVPDSDKKQSVEKLIEASYPSAEFYLMVVLSVAMATFGLLLNNSSIVIGSMLIAPVLYPILSTSMGIVMNNNVVLRKSFSTLIKAVLVSIVSSFLVATLFGDPNTIITSNEIISRTVPSLLYAGVAVVAGFAASFALLKPKLSETLPGIAISVALVPPLAVTGIGISVLSLPLIKGSFLLFLINILGIIFTSMLVFSLMNLYKKGQIAEKAIQKEDKKAQG
jgi:uncharacterized hydrophobic protein (TIGR00271 family)